MYRIYQVKEDMLREYGFRGYDEATDGGGKVEKKNYDIVYEFELESSCELRLDDIYEIFNIHRPEDFHGHSLSVSDVIETDDGFYYCDSIGWKKLNWRKDEPER